MLDNCSLNVWVNRGLMRIQLRRLFLLKFSYTLLSWLNPSKGYLDIALFQGSTTRRWQEALTNYFLRPTFSIEQ